MKIIFICSNPNYSNGEHFTPEADLFVSIKQAAEYAAENQDCIQALDIADLSDIEDVTTQVAEYLTKQLFENCENVPQYALGQDMEDFIQDLQSTIAEENQYQRQVQAQYASGAL